PRLAGGRSCGNRRRSWRRSYAPPRAGWARFPIATPSAGNTDHLHYPATGHLEPGVGAQDIEVVGILVAAGNGKDPGTQDVVDAVRHERLVTRVRDQPRKCIRDPEQHDAAVRGDPPAVERRHDLLAMNGRKAEQGHVWRAKGGGHGVTRGEQGNGRVVMPIHAVNSKACTTLVSESLLCAE